METTTKQVKFKKHYVTDGATKVPCHYSMDNRADKKKCVTVWAKDYGDGLAKVFNGGEYKNGTDIQTDYFEHGHVDIVEGHPLYAEARATAEAKEKANKERWAATLKRREEKRAKGVSV